MFLLCSGFPNDEEGYFRKRMLVSCLIHTGVLESGLTQMLRLNWVIVNHYSSVNPDIFGGV